MTLISTAQNYRDKIMQIITMRYNLKFRRLTLYDLTRPQSIRKLGLNSRSCGLLKIVCPEICVDFLIDWDLVKPYRVNLEIVSYSAL